MFKRTARASDGLDDRIWRRTVNLIEAVHRGDAKAHADEFRSWQADLSIEEQRRMELYIRYLLGQWLHRELRGDYEPARLRTTAEAVQPACSRIVTADVDTLTEIFRDALGVPEPADTRRGMAVDMIASAALGSLLQDPSRELDEMRAPLAAYYTKHRDELRQVEEHG